jgi:hypothetical protein
MAGRLQFSEFLELFPVIYHAIFFVDVHSQSLAEVLSVKYGWFRRKTRDMCTP